MNTLTERNKTFNLEPTHSFFESKEHFQNFVNSWKTYINEENHLCDTYIDSNGGTCKKQSSLTCAHHLLYNVLRKRDLRKSFIPLTNKSKLENTKYNVWGAGPANGEERPYISYDIARRFISMMCDKIDSKHWERIRERFFEPFGDTVTDDMLKEVNEVLKTINL